MRRLLFFTAIALAPLAACSKKADKTESAQHDESELPSISIADVEKGLADKSLTIYDCNNDKTRKKHGVIAGATLIDDTEAYPASVLPTDKAAKIVFYCGGPG